MRTIALMAFIGYYLEQDLRSLSHPDYARSLRRQIGGIADEQGISHNDPKGSQNGNRRRVAPISRTISTARTGRAAGSVLAPSQSATYRRTIKGVKTR
jgi:hypothetical protein